VGLNRRKKEESKLKILKIPHTARVKAYLRQPNVPSVTLSGFWLARYGFSVGSAVGVFASGATLTVKLDGVACHLEDDLGRRAPTPAYIINRPARQLMVPALTLYGAQLTGFVIGERVRIEAEWGLIYITRREF